MFLVAETFLSINGEGLHPGEMAFFIRLAGCPLRCSYCDTAWAQGPESGKETSLAALLAQIQASPAPHVTLTGGEPLAADGVASLIEAVLTQTDKNLEIETSGGVDIEPFIGHFGKHERFHLTVDRKLGSSAMADRMIEANYSLLRKNDVIKYVIGSEADLREAMAHLSALYPSGNGGHAAKHRPTPIFSPVYGQIDAKRLVEAVLEAKLSTVRIQLQLHKYIWEPNQQGV